MLSRGMFILETIKRQKLLLLVSLNAFSGNTAVSPLFGYQESIKSNLDLFPQWLSVLDRHEKLLLGGSRCTPENKKECGVEDWLSFIESIKTLPELEQIHKVNEYANSRPDDCNSFFGDSKSFRRR